MRANEHAVDGDLHSVADDSHSGQPSAIGVADAVVRAGEADRARGIDLAGHLVALGGSLGPRLGREGNVGVHEVAARVAGDQDVAVVHVEQPIVARDLDPFAAVDTTDVIAEAELAASSSGRRVTRIASSARPRTAARRASARRSTPK